LNSDQTVVDGFLKAGLSALEFRFRVFLAKKIDWLRKNKLFWFGRVSYQHNRTQEE